MGLQFTIRPTTTDRVTISEVFLMGPYSSQSGYELSDTDMVVDVGANIGAFTIFAASRCRQGHVYAVEPISECFDLLTRNVALNRVENVTLCNLGLYSENGTQEIFANDAYSSLYWKDTSGHSEIIETVSLESFFENHGLREVDLLKLDCEGAEFDILLNAPEVLLTSIHRIEMEFHNVSRNKHVNTLKGVLRKHGFHIDHCEGEWNGLLRARNPNVRRRDYESHKARSSPIMHNP